MNAYLPEDPGNAAAALLALPIALIIGHFVTHTSSAPAARLLSWLLVVTGVGGIELFTKGQPPGFRMLAIIGMLLCTMKIVVTTEVHLS